MNVKNIGWKKLILVFVLALSNSAFAVNGEIFSQTVFLHKFRNPITQNKLVLTKSLQTYDIFGGFYFDHDRKTDAEQVFTDAQVAPLIGIRTNTFGPVWLMSRLTAETRFVHRTKSFTDDRAKNTYEVRAGFIGYGYNEFVSKLFLENYYAAFFSRLYGEKFILQGWARQGFRTFSNFDLFNEIFFDTFDQTRDRDGTLDLRPGARLFKNIAGGSVQLLHQRVYHFTNTAYAGRYESRTTLVFGFNW